MQKCLVVFLMTLFSVQPVFSQDTISRKFSFHLQSTLVPQYHVKFPAPYSGANSLERDEKTKMSVTATLFAAFRPCRNFYLVFDPEASGGKGLSGTTGVAGFPNGETYRVGNPHIQPFIARLYGMYRFPLSSKTGWVEDDLNQVHEKVPVDYISVIAGKFSLQDFFDNSSIAEDPRTQFLNWSIMSDGAWDYAANTRGYVEGLLVQSQVHNWIISIAETSVPTTANGSVMEWRGAQAGSTIVEADKEKAIYKNEKRYSSLHAGFFLNKARMGNYQQSVQTGLITNLPPDITDSRQYGRTKFGFYTGMDNHFHAWHQFIKMSWSDGKNETWAFTEIDRSMATGIALDAVKWKRNKDRIGLAFSINGLSPDHRNYLAKGGYGFIIGDGKLNYGAEEILECYYSFNVSKYFYLSADYQFINRPAYNKDRGPVHCLALRFHLEW
jgi:high affinity Mn2+ porin